MDGARVDVGPAVWTPPWCAHTTLSTCPRRLLLLPRDQAAAVLSALQRQPGAAKEVLRPMGVKLLSVDQAATVLMQRLDLLTSGH